MIEVINTDLLDSLAPDLEIPMEDIVRELVGQRAGETSFKRAGENPEFLNAQSEASVFRDKAQSMLDKEFYIKFESALVYEMAILNDCVYKQGFMDGMKFIMAMK